MTRVRGNLLARVLHAIFLSSLTVQALIGASQLIGALALRLATSDGWANRMFEIARQELAEDPSDPFARMLLMMAHGNSFGSETFWSIYLIGHGVLNLGVVAALLAKRPWAEPLSITVLSGFIVYQMYRFAVTQSWVMIALSVFDAIVIALIWREYSSPRED